MSQTGDTLSFLSECGEMGRRIRSYDWSTHPLGPKENWPQSLKIVIRIMLTSRYAMWMGWGKEFYFFCNDAYLPTVGLKESWVLGASARKVWEEIWQDIGPRAESVVKTGKATWDESLLLFLERSGYPEETYHTFSYSPVPDDHGSVGGMLCVVTEETSRVISERRMALLRELASSLAGTKIESNLFRHIESRVQEQSKDIPFALIYLYDNGSDQARLVAAAGVPTGSSMAPRLLSLQASQAAWPAEEARSKATLFTVQDLKHRFSEIPFGPWDIPPRAAAIVPIEQQGQDQPAGFIVVGLNPYRPFDASYSGFLNLLAGQIAAGLSSCRAYEEERKRAEALAEIDRAKTAFFSNVSHEFRTPLTLMIGPLEELKGQLKQSTSPSQFELVELIHRNSLRLLKLVNTLLDFSRIEAGRIQANFQPIDLASLTQDLASVFRSVVEKAGLKLLIDCPPLAKPISVDREMWEKIVLNLISNAFKFTFEGEIEVRLRQNGEAAELLVRDTGIGVPEDQLERIFDRFHRVPGSRGRSFEGTGIGLSLVHELVKLHNGSITVESALGKGTTFRILIPISTLPRMQAELQPSRADSAHTQTRSAAFLEEAWHWLPSENQIPAISTAEWQAGPLQNESRKIFTDDSIQASRKPVILLADDNEDMRSYVKRLLVEQGYEVRTVANGKAALQLARNEHPDLVLSDVMMPQMDGFELVHALRSDERTSTLPIILLSARAGEESRIEGLSQGADDYLIKPFSARELVARVRTHINLAKARSEIAKREQHLLNQALESPRRLENMLSGFSDQVYMLDREWRYTYVNDQVPAAVGLQKTSLLGYSIWDIFPALNGTSFESDLRRAAKENVPLHFEYYYPEWRRWFENHVYPSPAGLIVFVTDVTQRKQSEENARFVSQLSQDLALLSDPIEIQLLTCRTVSQYLDVERCYFFELDDGAKRALIKENWRRYSDMPSLSGSYELSSFGPPEFWQTLTAGPVAVENVFTNSKVGEFASSYSALDIASFATSPFLREGRWVAALCVTNKTVRQWQQHELALLDSVTARVWPLVERARSEQSLRESEMRFRNMAENSPLMLWVTDASGYCSYLNQRWYEFTGSDPKTSMGFGWLDAVHPEDRAKAKQAFLTAHESHAPFRFEYRLRRADGVYRWAIDAAAPRLSENGEYLGYIGQVVDISEVREAEQVARESRERLDLVISASQVGVWFCDLPFSKLHWDAKVKEHFWLPPETDVTIELFYDRLHPDDREPTRQAIERSIVERTRYQKDLRTISPNGQEKWIRALGQTYYNGENQPYRFDGVTFDITEMVQARETLKERQIELERLVNERTSKLRETIAELEAFSYSVSHDMRSPLRAMQGYATALLEEYGSTLDSEGIDYLERISKAAKRLDLLIQDVLAYSRVAKGDIELKKIDLSLLLADIVHHYPLFQAPNASIIISDQLPSVFGHEGYLTQCISNILGNAVKFVPKGTTPEVRVYATDEEDWVRLWFKDNGIGIDPSHHAQIFQIFGRVYSEKTFEGTGIGLAIVKKAVERMSGSVGVESELGKGSAFWIRLLKANE